MSVPMTVLTDAANAAARAQSTWRTFSHLNERLLSLDDGYASPDVTFLPLQAGAIQALQTAYGAYLAARAEFFTARAVFEAVVAAEPMAILRGDAA
jgi:hypothetical protein